MKILNIMQCTNLGGMERAALRQMIALQERGHSCEVISLNPIGALGPLLVEAGIPAFGLSYRGTGGWRSAPTLRRKLAEVSADALIMTGHNLSAMLLLNSVVVERRVLAIHFHHHGVKPRWQWRLIYRLACDRFKAVTFASDFIRREAEEIYPPVAAVAHTVRNPLPLPGLPTPADKLAARTALGLPSDAVVIGNAGWLIPRKRFDVFLQVARVVRAALPRAHFVIAGDGEERTKLEALARELGIEDALTWLGWRRDLTPFYHAIDVLLFSTDWDAFPTTPLEAMSYGVPVVASASNSGLAEVISAPDHGFLSREHNPIVLANAVLSCLCTDFSGSPCIARARIGTLCNVDRSVKAMEHLLTCD